LELGLQNKVVVITGGTKGIGLSLAKGFLQEGAMVHIISRTANPVLKETFEKEFPSGSFFFYQCDVIDEQSLQQTSVLINQNTNGVIDVVISNIGNGSGTQAAIVAKDEWKAAWDVNFITALNTSRVFASSLKKTKGSLLFVSSIAGLEFIGAPTAYNTAKAALIPFAKTLSHRMAPEVRVNVVAPGNIWVAGGTWDKKMKEDEAKVISMLNTKVPLQRFGLPEEVSDLILFLSSEKANFITGASFVIDGGQTTKF